MLTSLSPDQIDHKRKQIRTLQEMYPEPSADIQAAIDGLKAQTGDAEPAAADPKDQEIAALRASLDAALKRIAMDGIRLGEQARDIDHLAEQLNTMADSMVGTPDLAVSPTLVDATLAPSGA